MRFILCAFLCILHLVAQPQNISNAQLDFENELANAEKNKSVQDFNQAEVNFKRAIEIARQNN